MRNRLLPTDRRSTNIELAPTTPLNPFLLVYTAIRAGIYETSIHVSADAIIGDILDHRRIIGYA